LGDRGSVLFGRELRLSVRRHVRFNSEIAIAHPGSPGLSGCLKHEKSCEFTP
jgi:hypothetical protein